MKPLILEECILWKTLILATHISGIVAGVVFITHLANIPFISGAKSSFVTELRIWVPRGMGVAFIFVHAFTTYLRTRYHYWRVLPGL